MEGKLTREAGSESLVRHDRTTISLPRAVSAPIS